MSVYPQLEPNAPQFEPKADNFRLTKISEIQKAIQTESENRRKLYKKYRRAINAVEGIDIWLGAVSLGSGIAGVSVLVALPPLVIPLECVSIICQLLTMIGTIVNRRLAVKAKKHEDIKVLADAKLNTISCHISKALQDNNISDDEFNLVVNEMDKYNALKQEIRTHATKKNQPEDQEKLLQEAKEQIIKNLKIG